MKISDCILNRIIYIYITIPLLIFLMFWLKPVYAAVSICVLICIIVSLFKAKIEPESINIKKVIFTATLLIALLWCILAGIGGLFYQNEPDWHYRNAIMHDLIDFSWPVIYDNGSALVYYFGYFLPSAIIGKMFLFLGFNNDYSFKIANYFALLWSAVGISLVFLKLYFLIPVKDSKKIFICMLFILFSGMDILLESNESISMMIDYHFCRFLYPSNTTILFFCYNQIICSWLIVFLFFKDYKNINNLGFYFVLMFFYAPMQAIGIFLFFFVMCILELIKGFKEKLLKNTIKNIFDLKNILSVLVLFPVIFLFMKSNYMTTGVESLSIEIEYIKFLFIIEEVLIFFILLLPTNSKNPIYWTAFLYLTILPFCNNALAHEMIMRVCLPSLAILSVFTIRLILTEIKNNQKLIKICRQLIIICFIIGTVTPMFEIVRGVTYSSDRNCIIKDEIKTLNNGINSELAEIMLKRDYMTKLDQYYLNYGSLEPNNYPFWKYLAAPKRNRNKT